MTQTVRLHGYYRSSTSYRLRIALNLKGLAFEPINIALDQGEQHSTSFRSLNPIGGVPVLEIDGFTLTQTPAIFAYLEEHHTSPALLPAATAARQMTRQISGIIECDMHPLNNLSVLKYLQNELGSDSDAVGAWYRHWIARGFSAIEALLETIDNDGHHCVGDRPTYADVCLVPQVYNARRFDADMSPYPRLTAIDAALTRLPAFASAHPDAFS